MSSKWSEPHLDEYVHADIHDIRFLEQSYGLPVTVESLNLLMVGITLIKPWLVLKGLIFGALEQVLKVMLCWADAIIMEHC